MNTEKIDLEYTDLEIEYVTRHGNPTGYYDSALGGWLPDEDETATTTIRYTYEVDKDAVITLIIENYLTETDCVELDNIEDTTALREFVEKNFDLFFTKYEEQILSYYYDDAVEDAESDYDPRDYIDWDSMPGGHDDYQFDESFDISDYDYAGYERGYDIYRKVVDGKGVWAARYVGDGEEHEPFEITYEQALGKEPIKDTYGIDKLAKYLGRTLLPNETLKEAYVNIDNIDKSLIDELNAWLKENDCYHRADVVRIDDVDKIYFDVTWGDWKHDHMRLWYLVNNFFRDRGYIVEREIIETETDGSDTFSAEHYYTVQGDDESDEVKAMLEWYGDHPDLKPLAGDACSAMGKLVQSLTNTNKDDWKEQINQEDIEAMKHASNAAWLLYHYKNDGKVRPINR